MIITIGAWLAASGGYANKSLLRGGLLMSKKDGYSRKNLFGNISHYDSFGHKVGESRRGLFDGWNNYDTNGNKIGRSSHGIFGELNHYDNHGRKTGQSRQGLFSGIDHYDANGRKTATVPAAYLVTGITMMIKRYFRQYAGFDSNGAACCPITRLPLVYLLHLTAHRKSTGCRPDFPGACPQPESDDYHKFCNNTRRCMCWRSRNML